VLKGFFPLLAVGIALPRHEIQVTQQKCSRRWFVCSSTRLEHGDRNLEQEIVWGMLRDGAGPSPLPGPSRPPRSLHPHTRRYSSSTRFASFPLRSWRSSSCQHTQREWDYFMKFYTCHGLVGGSGSGAM